MEKTKKYFAILLAVSIAFSITGCGGSSNESSQTSQPASQTAPDSQGSAVSSWSGTVDKERAALGELTAADLGVNVTSTDQVKLVWAHNGSSQSASTKGYVYMQQLIQDGSNGNITFEIYPDSQLGSATEINQNLKANTIQIGCGNVGGLVDDSLAYFDMNGVIQSREDALLVSETGTEVRSYTENVFNNLGFELIALTPYGFRVTSSKDALNTFDDLNGLDIRVTENNLQMSFWKACGANPTPLPFSDLYVSLQQGLVKAQENPFNTIVTNKFYEVQNYVTTTNHQMFVAGIWMNKSCYDDLPVDYQELIKAAAMAAEHYLYQVGVDEEVAARQTLIDEGITLIEWSEADYASMRKAGESCWQLIRELAGDEPVDMLLKALEI